MKYMGDSNWWNERFRGRDLNLMCHEKCLEEDIKLFPINGEVLDVACGDGRNSIYLSRLSYSVNAIDFSEEALTRLNYFSKKENIDIKTRVVDLSTNDVFGSLDKYDVIIINHYRLHPKLYNSLMSHINKGGILWINGFREVPNDNPNITEEDILTEEDFVSLNNYNIIDKKLYETDEKKFIRYIFQK